MNYRTIDRESYYRKGVFRHFSEDCKCSTSMTARIDVTDFVEYSQKTKTKFYINFLYILTKVMNSREDYRMGYLWQTEELVCLHAGLHRILCGLRGVLLQCTSGCGTGKEDTGLWTGFGTSSELV